MEVLIIVALVLLAIVGAPLFCVFGAAGMILFAREGSITSAADDVFSPRFADSPMLVSLPLLAFAGFLMAESGTPKRVLRVSRSLFGWLPGGIGVVCLCTSAFFTTMTGSSSVTIVALGGLLLPALIEEKYPERFSLGLVTTSGSLGRLFPPSIPIGAYAVVAGILIDKLSLAGVVPGTLIVLLFVAYTIVTGWKRRAPGPEAWASFKQLLRWIAAFVAAAFTFSTTMFTLAFLLPATRPWLAEHARIIGLPGLLFAFIAAMFATSGEARAALRGAIWELILPFLLIAGLALGGLRFGYEAAAFTALYLLIVEVFVYRDIRITSDLPRVIKKSIMLVGVVLAILATGFGLTGFMVHAEVPGAVIGWMDGIVGSPVVFLLLLDVCLLIVGMLMDPFTAIVVLVPLIVPLGRHYGIDEYHLGIVVVLSLEIGSLLPPLGLNPIVSAFRFEKPMTKVWWAVLPFVALLVLALAVVTYVPDLSMAFASLIPTEAAGASPEPDLAPEGEIPPPPDDLFEEIDVEEPPP